MKVTIDDIGPIQKRLSIELPPDMVVKELDSAYARLNKTVKIKGFRQGKTPRKIMEKFYAPQVEGEVIETLIRKTLSKAIDEAKFVLILQPQLDSVSPIKTDEAFSYSVILDLWPEFDLTEYKGIEIEKPEVFVTDQELDEQLEALRSHFSTIEAINEDRPLEEGDIAIIDYSGEVDGIPVEGLCENNYYLEVGKGYFNKEFEKYIIGMTIGDKRTVEIAYPENAINAKLAGKTIHYNVVLKDIKKRVMPALNDEFAQKFSPDYKTLDDLKERLKKQIMVEKEKAVESYIRNQIIDRLAADIDFPIPERLIEAKLTQMMDNISGYLHERGVDFEKVGISQDRLKDKMRNDAIKQVKIELILDKIADKENITVENEELTRYIDQQSSTKIDKHQLMTALVQHVLPKLRAKKTLDFILEHAVIKSAVAKAGTRNQA
ncbi:MAG: trigger factor [Dissulfurimicrobium sp.]|uniref:trigger factor n=1 Tax=Dissulfurimicrobium sp. TaxID=2022436 RepID=UPI00404A4103